MMESELLFQPSWPLYNTSILDHSYSGLYGFPMDDDPHDFSASFASGEPSGIFFHSPDSLVDFPSFGDENQVMKTIIAGIVEGSARPIEEDCSWMEESDSEGNLSSQLTSESDAWTTPTTPPLEQSKPSSESQCKNMMAVSFPSETDSLVCLNHLLRAYGEAMENGHQELTEVIVRRINEKIDPLGEPLERVAFNLFQSDESQGNYLRQQSAKNLEAAFEAFYQWCPNGRFAHFAANSAILQAMPSDVDTVHLVDFDMGEGIQWPPLIEAISRRGKKSLRFTSIKSEEDSYWNFDDTKQRLCDYGRSVGLSLTVEAMELEDLVSEIKRMKKRGGAREWLAFNLMVALPHMGRRRNTIYVAEFLRVAKDLLACSAGNRGIITYGDGEAGDRSSTWPEFASFFNAHFKHYQALFESMVCSFPANLPEARIAMESLFVAPFISSGSWLQQWKDTRENVTIPGGLESWRMSRESFIEAREIAKKQHSSYEVFFQGKENEMVRLPRSNKY